MRAIRRRVSIVALLTVVVLTGCARSEGQGVPQRAEIVFSGDTIPSVWSSGEPFVFAKSGGKPVVIGGFMDAEAGAKKVYVESSLRAPITRLGAEFRIDDSAGQLMGSSGSFGVVTWNDGGVVREGLGRRTRSHVWVSRTEVGYQTRVSEGGELANVARYQFSKPLDIGVTYRLEVRLNGNTATVALPDGNEWNVTDKSIASDDEFACFEPFYQDPSTDMRFRVSRMWFEVER